MNIFPLQGNVHIHTTVPASFLNPFVLLYILGFLEVVSYEIIQKRNFNVYLRNVNNFTSEGFFLNVTLIIKNKKSTFHWI